MMDKQTERKASKCLHVVTFLRGFSEWMKITAEAFQGYENENKDLKSFYIQVYFAHLLTYSFRFCFYNIYIQAASNHLSLFSWGLWELCKYHQASAPQAFEARIKQNDTLPLSFPLRLPSHCWELAIWLLYRAGQTLACCKGLWDDGVILFPVLLLLCPRC